MVKARQYVVKKHFEGLPKREDFEIVEYELPAIQNGEILVKTEWVSVDPFLRAYNSRYTTPFEQFGFQVGIVEESKDPAYPVGCRISSIKGWCDYSVVNVTEVKPVVDNFVPYKLPDLKDLSPSLGVGAMGMPGAAAYFGFLKICQPKEGETVVITTAAGAVGTLVGQIAKIKGCKVIGFTGSDDKVEVLEKELGFDRAFNYKTVNVNEVLKKAAPDGVDIYFDNVGGEISRAIIKNMKTFGRVAICGCISVYNELTIDTSKASILQTDVLFKELKIEGFIISRWFDVWPEAFADLIKWISSGQIKIKEHITEGFDNIYDAFVGMLNGENIGKAVVKI